MAGCDVIATEKYKFLKRDIGIQITQALSNTTGNRNTNMEYIQYEKKIVQGMGVVLEGWPLDKPLSHPSTLGNSIGKLEKKSQPSVIDIVEHSDKGSSDVWGMIAVKQ
ncbi:hypothetical protein FISHEDRAFT_78912 [Fistulina hepatica ATCC 64428]|uniref:Uncharacterized protein n=1 Tax=Fistulina hepatica ATCC 64428 TaxID=1128425 RepID=A0A0D6ZZU4_9AGAR|nr:hypothetical protein FISHEDRAFT_78912 [Fistulina hepatica ATCC 64428]